MDHKLPGEYLYEGMVFCDGFRVHSMEKIRCMTFVKDDILIASYPKTGTTWMEEITWAVNKEADLKEALAEPLDSRMPFLEMDHEKTNQPGIESLRHKQRPAIMKTHLPAKFFEKEITRGDVKVVLVVRNPKDTLVSYYHFYRSIGPLGYFPGTFNEFFGLYKSKRLLYGDFFEWYSSWLPYLNLPNVQIFAYEDMKSDSKTIIHQLCGYLGKLLSDDQVEKIVDHTTFKSMKANMMTNYHDSFQVRNEISPFMRNGKVGDWTSYFSSEQSRFVEDEYKSKLESKGFMLKFE